MPDATPPRLERLPGHPGAPALPELPEPFSLALRRDGNGPVLEARGELDIATERTLRETVAALVDGGARLVALDLSALAFVDCAGLRALARACADAEANGTRVELRRPSRAVRRIVALTGLAPAGGFAAER